VWYTELKTRCSQREERERYNGQICVRKLSENSGVCAIPGCLGEVESASTRPNPNPPGLRCHQSANLRQISLFFGFRLDQNVGHGATGRLLLFSCSCRSHVPDNCFCVLSDTYKAVSRHKNLQRNPRLEARLKIRIATMTTLHRKLELDFFKYSAYIRPLKS
jgi:hypothetical protein